MPANFPVVKNEATAAKRRVTFFCVDATDLSTPETGEAGGQPQISTDGATWTNTGIGTLTSMGNGAYYAEVSQAAVNIDEGSHIYSRYKSANTAESRGDQVIMVVPSGYWAAWAPASTALSNSTWTDAKAGYLTGGVMEAGSYVAPPSASTNASAVRTELTTELGRIDATVSSRLASASYTAPPSASTIATAVAGEASIAAALTAYTPARGALLDHLDSDVSDCAQGSATLAANLVQIDGESLAAHTAGAMPDSSTLLVGAVSSATTNTIGLTDGISDDHSYSGCRVIITSGPGAGQARVIVAYEGSAKVATLQRDWTVLPTTASEFAVVADDVLSLPGILDITGINDNLADILAAVGDVQTAVQPAGLYTLAIDTVDEDGARVAGCTVVVYADDNSVLWRVITSGTAPSTLALDAGTYHVRVSRPGYTVTPATTEVTIADDTELEIELVADDALLPQCTIYGTLIGPDGALVGETIEIEIATPSEFAGWNFGGTRTTMTNDDGVFSIAVPQGARVAVTIQAIGWDHEIRTVPALSSRAIAGWVA